MIRSYLPALVFVGLGAILGLVFAFANALLGPRNFRAQEATADPYECGLPSEVKKNFRFGISFYLIAMLFILFDIEVIFLYPVAIQLDGVRHLRPGRDDRLHRAADDRLRLRLEKGGARMEVKRQKLGNGADGEFRARQLAARAMLRGELEGPDLDKHVEDSPAADDAREGAELGPRQRDVPGHLRARLLRDRDDGHRRRARRRRALRLGGLPRLARARPT